MSWVDIWINKEKATVAAAEPGFSALRISTAGHSSTAHLQNNDQSFPLFDTSKENGGSGAELLGDFLSKPWWSRWQTKEFHFPFSAGQRNEAG